MTGGSSARLHIVVLGAQPEYITGLRGPMIRDFLAAGHRVTAIGAEEMPHVRQALESWGARYVVVALSRNGLNPVKDLGALWNLCRTLRRLRPDLLFAYSIKPIVYGLPLAWLGGVPLRFAMIAGRGFAFLPGRDRRRRLAKALAGWTYWFALKFASGVLFHNDDDWELFRSSGLLKDSTRAKRIFGSGIDLEQYYPVPLPEGPVTFLMISRLLADKGVEEFVAAARLLKRDHPEVRFRLVGPSDPSPNAISAARIEEWKREGAVEFVGPVEDVRPCLAQSHVYVLPSYGEGLPRSVLEAMATGRPVVTTRVAGCRDTVVEGETGYLVPARDAGALAQAMERFIASPETIAPMGAEGLQLARERFDVRKVNRSIMSFLGVDRSPPRPGPPE